MSEASPSLLRVTQTECAPRRGNGFLTLSCRAGPAAGSPRPQRREPGSPLSPPRAHYLPAAFHSEGRKPSWCTATGLNAALAYAGRRLAGLNREMLTVHLGNCSQRADVRDQCALKRHSRPRIGSTRYRTLPPEMSMSLLPSKHREDICVPPVTVLATGQRR